jgi:alcohol dehydrogenase
LDRDQKARARGIHVGRPQRTTAANAGRRGGGVVANIGVHGKPVELHLERLWSQNVAITTRPVDTVTTPMLLKTVQSKKIDPTRLISHHFTFDQIVEAYDTFSRAAETGALKVMITM